MTYRKPKTYLPPEMYESWGGLFMPKKYEVLNKRTWVTAYDAKIVGQSLHYRLIDKSEGVAKPSEWRVKGEISTVTVASLPKHRYVPDDDDNILEI